VSSASHRQYQTRTIDTKRIDPHRLASKKDASANVLQRGNAAPLVDLAVHQLKCGVEGLKVHPRLRIAIANEYSTPAHDLRALRMNGRALEALASTLGQRLVLVRDAGGLGIASDGDTRATSNQERDRGLGIARRVSDGIDGMAVSDRRREHHPQDWV